MTRAWEDFVTLNSTEEPTFEPLPPAASHFESDSRKNAWQRLDYQDALAKDTYALPATKGREGYYGQDHFSYWASGLQDANMLLDAANKYDLKVNSYLDIGCASGRVIRHFAVQHPTIKTYGCDINRFHVEWCNTFLPKPSVVFQNHSIPTLPLPDAELDLVSAFSVFTHIEAMETAWLMEILRVLRPGGLAWLTVHTEETLREMDETWPLWNATMKHRDRNKLIDLDRNFSGNRVVFRWDGGSSYTSNVFYKLSYITDVWGRILNILEIRRRYPLYQDVVLVQKPAS